MDLFLGDAKIETEITDEVWTLDIIDPNDLKMIAFMSNTSLLSEDSIQEKVNDQQKKMGLKGKAKTTQVTVSILEMEWISEYKNLVEFYRYISSQDADKFANDLIITILQQQKFSGILYFVFSVYLTFMTASVLYLSYFLFEEPKSFFDGPASSICRVIIFLTSLMLSFFEYGSLLNGQYISKKGVEIFANLLMFCILIMTNVVVFMHSTNYTHS